MTNPQPKLETKPATAKSARLDDGSVAAFLAGHPDFFERHPALLAALRLPHVRGDGSTVSLVERQLEVLRERTREFELRLKTMIDNGRSNDALAAKIQRLALRLIHARSVAQRLAAIEASLREDFAVREFVILVTRAGTGLEAVEQRCLRVVPADEAGLRSFESLFSSGKPRCGRVRDSQREFLFPATDTLVGSAALVPLGAGGALGLLAISSPDADHFNPTMSTDYLARIGELIATALDASPDRPAA
jgi:uncharacterized protein YigA (DUF484 family)